MKLLFTFIIPLLTMVGCSGRQKSTGEKLPGTTPAPKTEKIFTAVADFPVIKDSARFMLDLRQSFNLAIHESPVQKENEKITAFKKVQLYGSGKDYFFIEYDWVAGPMAAYPWKNQLLVTADGKPVKVFAGQRFDFVTIFPGQNPFLLLVTVTGQGNGVHEVYKFSGDTLENVYDGYLANGVHTYDAHEDMDVNKPNELAISFEDHNKDGYNDITFTGQKLMLGKYTKDSLWYDVENGKPFTVKNPAGRIPVQYVFLYDRQTGHFGDGSIFQK